jgi:hypothetical protein
MKVENMTSSKGNKVANQFIITDKDGFVYFQSYGSIIAMREPFRPEKRDRQVWLDPDYWDYSKTTGKYRNIFLGETKAETQKKIDSGEYILTDLN